MPKRTRLEAQLAGSSARSVFMLTRQRTRAADAEEDEPSPARGPSGAFKRKVAMTLAPFRQVFRICRCDGIDGSEDVQFAFADIQALLRLSSRKCDALARIVREASSMREPLQAVLSHDECTAGNVLATDARQKVTLLYLTFLQYGKSVESETAWIPISSITHNQVERCKNGIASVTCSWLREWHDQDLMRGFDCNGQETRVRLALYISDFDALRYSLDAMGSAGIRPCVLCSNIVSKASRAPERNDHFCWISEHDTGKFELTRHQEIIDLYEDIMPRAPAMTAEQRKLRERCCGFKFNHDNLWNCDISRNLLTLDKIMCDSMHCYCAQGIASQELLLWFNHVSAATGSSLEELAKAAVDMEWKRPACRRQHGEGKAWLRRLFRPKLWQGKLYKGSAAETWLLVLLLRWFTLSMGWNEVEEIRTKYLSFKYLCRCLDTLSNIGKTRQYDALARFQQEHQRAFASAYDGLERPKHHHRMHLPQQYKDNEAVVSCWATESKHKLYKGRLAAQTQHFLKDDEGGREHSCRLLPRLLLLHCDRAAKTPLMLGKDFQVLRPIKDVSADERTRQFYLPGYTAGTRLRSVMLDVSEGDVLLCGKSNVEAGIVKFFAVQPDGQLLLCWSLLAFSWKDESQMVFKATQQDRCAIWQNLTRPRLPTWYTYAGEEIVCIP